MELPLIKARDQRGLCCATGTMDQLRNYIAVEKKKKDLPHS